jgi:shikimate kinase
VEELWERCRREKHRPLAQNLNQFRQLHENRRPLYMKAALRIETSGKDAGSIADEIAAQLGLAYARKEK